jgi:6-hydroxycyclohex-1-ene-1-carbonyl-CoA dehydrogenase
MGAKPIRWMMTGAGKPFVPMEFEIGTLGPDEVLVEIAGCGVCHTDLGYYYDGVRTKHELPLALGHEISGHVIDTGADALWFTDRAVIIPAVIPCGQCDACKRGKATICPNQKMPGNDIQGGFATHIVVPARGLCVVDEHRLAGVGIDLADLSVIADAVTTPYQAVVQAGVTKGDLVIVNGIGGVGGYAVQIAAALGGVVVAIDVNQEKLAAITGQGAALTLNSKQMSTRDLKTAIQAFAKEHGLRQTEWIIFECSGSRAGQETAFSLLNHGATLAVVGFTMDKVEVRLSNLMAYHARAIGNWGCPPELYPAALELVMSGRVKVTPFVEKHPLSEINQVFEAVHAGAIKRRAVLVPAPLGAAP